MKSILVIIWPTTIYNMQNTQSISRHYVVCVLLLPFFVVTEGMKAFMNVHQCGRPKPPIEQSLTGRVRRYYIAVEEVEWDYAPSGTNLYHGGRLDTPGR